jgi:hypothetical protein
LGLSQDNGISKMKETWHGGRQVSQWEKMIWSEKLRYLKGGEMSQKLKTCKCISNAFLSVIWLAVNANSGSWQTVRLIWIHVSIWDTTIIKNFCFILSRPTVRQNKPVCLILDISFRLIIIFVRPEAYQTGSHFAVCHSMRKLLTILQD